MNSLRLNKIWILALSAIKILPMQYRKVFHKIRLSSTRATRVGLQLVADSRSRFSLAVTCRSRPAFVSSTILTPMIRGRSDFLSPRTAPIPTPEHSDNHLQQFSALATSFDR